MFYFTIRAGEFSPEHADPLQRPTIQKVSGSISLGYSGWDVRLPVIMTQIGFEILAV